MPQYKKKQKTRNVRPDETNRKTGKNRGYVYTCMFYGFTICTVIIRLHKATYTPTVVLAFLATHAKKKRPFQQVNLFMNKC